METGPAQGPTGPQTTLQRQKRQVTVDALVHAAQRGLTEYGFDVTVDDIAALADVGRRTVFRHFATRDDLLLAALAASTEEHMRGIPQYPGGDWEAWLAEVTAVMHRVAADAGRLSWEARTRRLPPRLAASVAENRGAIERVHAGIAAILWEAAGGRGTPPERLRRIMAVHLNPLFTHTVVHEAGGTAELAAELAANAIATAVRRLLDDRTTSP
ncbi:TetR/AcrR family transcriptional regulator [Streptomyces sp. MMS24-I2-30]|uniref:TetR/AcrR family transcriptional regulator n=1 Tax=Streptomyces sp. MMS24-I2-30 TaxID=3351564 RepID=UPI003896BD88